MIVVDVETGGLDPKVNPLLSIGAVDFNNPKNTFYGKCRDLEGMTISDEALKINGFKRKDIGFFPIITHTLTDFLNWIEKYKTDDILAGHNPRFDLDFIRTNCETFGFDCPFSYRTVDLHSIAFAKYGIGNGVCEPKLTSDRIYELLNMKPEPRPHNALTGAKMETEAFRKLMDLVD